MADTTAAAAVLLLVLLAASRRGDLLALVPAGPVALDDGSQETGQGGPGLEAAALLAPFDISPYMQPMTNTATADANLSAFLWMIRKAEGTAGPDGYRTLFGGDLFTGWADHPRQPRRYGNLWTSAAGAYQFMAVSPLPGGGSTRVDTWDRIARRLGLPDFTPASQDAAATALIAEAGALADVQAGRFDAAVSKVRRIWASLPGSGYGQPEKSLAYLRGVYADAGGAIA
jgi:lysozyme